MVLVDTSIWVDHLRSGNHQLVQLLAQNQVCMHPMIIGELACGHLRNRVELLDLWRNLPTAVLCNHEEAMICLEANEIVGLGVGWVDVHLLASGLLTTNARLWTKDKRLKRVAEKLAIDFVS